MKKRFFVITILILVVAIAYFLSYPPNWIKNSGNPQVNLTLSTSSKQLNLQPLPLNLYSPTQGSSESGTSFLVTEAGFCAYGNVGREINLTKAKLAFRGLEYVCEDYLIGSVPIPGYSESEDAHVYVHRTGWIVAYYTKEEFIAKIIKNFMTPDDNKLEDAITAICATLPCSKPNISYYDFRYPTANTVLIVGDESKTYYYNNTFRIYIPSEIASNISRVEWYYYSDGFYSSFGMHGQVICSGATQSYGLITLIPKEYPGELKPTELKMDTSTTIWVYQGSTGLITHGGFIILLHYD
jgi:hypothetical protein